MFLTNKRALDREWSRLFAFFAGLPEKMAKFIHQPQRPT
jgi:hypothetical protein